LPYAPTPIAARPQISYTRSLKLRGANPTSSPIPDTLDPRSAGERQQSVVSRNESNLQNRQNQQNHDFRRTGQFCRFCRFVGASVLVHYRRIRQVFFARPSTAGASFRPSPAGPARVDQHRECHSGSLSCVEPCPAVQIHVPQAESLTKLPAARSSRPARADNVECTAGGALLSKRLKRQVHCVNLLADYFLLDLQSL
jgi:hypothetical protein